MEEDSGYNMSYIQQITTNILFSGYIVLLTPWKTIVLGEYFFKRRKTECRFHIIFKYHPYKNASTLCSYTLSLQLKFVVNIFSSLKKTPYVTFTWSSNKCRKQAQLFLLTPFILLLLQRCPPKPKFRNNFSLTEEWQNDCRNVIMFTLLPLVSFKLSFSKSFFGVAGHDFEVVKLHLKLQLLPLLSFRQYSSLSWITFMFIIVSKQIRRRNERHYVRPLTSSNFFAVSSYSDQIFGSSSYTSRNSSVTTNDVHTVQVK